MTEQERKDYNRGWSASERYGSGRTARSPLDAADMRGESDAWYDGYYDHAAGREKA